MVSTICTHAPTLCGTLLIPTYPGYQQRYIDKEPGASRARSISISLSFSCKQSEVHFA